MLRWAVAAAVVVATMAGCPSLCSGHGTCSGNDKCSCFANWQGPDCSLRTCPFGNAWALDDADPHGYAECSAAGTCDRVSGECKCFAGFTGFSCQRSECPSDCSGHGLCRTLGEIPTRIPYGNDKWDADQLQACVCDPGFFGTDCSQLRCPTGDDPLTTCVNPNTRAVQEVRVSLAGKVAHTVATNGAGATTITNVPYTAGTEDMDVFGTSSTKNAVTLLAEEDFGQFRVGAVDAQGQAFYAPTSWKNVFSPEAGDLDAGAVALELALENIPGNKVRDVIVKAEYTSATAPTGAVGDLNVIEKRYLVTFVPDQVNSANVGVQNTLLCDAAYGCTAAGCAPQVRMPFLYRYASTPAFSALDASQGSPVNTYTFHTGTQNNGGSYIRLDAASLPTLPLGMKPAADGQDIRILVAVQGAASAAIPADSYYVKVTYGKSVIAADKAEYDPAVLTATGPFAATGATANQAAFFGTLKGYTSSGYVPADLKASLEAAPGVILFFPARKFVTSGSYRFFEILIKLPTCTVTPFKKAGDFLDIDNVAGTIVPVDPFLENVECSNRGQCNRGSGQCECYEGYYGVACQQQTVLV